MITVGYHLSDQQIAAAYDRFSAELTMPPYFHPCLARFVGVIGGLRVLDAGCGGGALLRLLAEAGGAELHGLEMSEALCGRARQALTTRAMIHQGNVQAGLPFSNHSFDLVVLSEVMEHLRRPDLVIGEVSRVLKAGGRIVVTMPNASAYEPFFSQAHRRDGAGRWLAFLPWEHPRKTRQPIDTVYSFEEIQSLFRRNGLRVTRMQGQEAFPYIWDWLYIETRRPVRALLQCLDRLRPQADRVLNRLGTLRPCYRLFIELRTEESPPTAKAAAGDASAWQR
jgi:2-polyprenyl-3-methyl-5-hydroxy-6-metoxy-1,4-benzoquinol methylase